MNPIAWALDIALVAVALAMLLVGWRLLRGPEAVDRVLALDTLYVNAVALVVLLGLRSGSGLARRLRRLGCASLHRRNGSRAVRVLREGAGNDAGHHADSHSAEDNERNGRDRNDRAYSTLRA